MYDVGILSLPKSFVMSCLLSMLVSVVAYCLSKIVDKCFLFKCACVCAFAIYAMFTEQILSLSSGFAVCGVLSTHFLENYL